VALVSQYFDTIEWKTAHREFITHTGTFNGKRITVLSTGIGTDNIDIVLNELDAAVNIDPVTRTARPLRRQLRIVRLGTSGSLQEDIPVNALVASSHGLGLDGLLPFYADWKSVNEDAISAAFAAHTGWPAEFAYPYCISADAGMLKTMGDGFYQGITATAPGFYGPQGRQLRLKPALPALNEVLASFRVNNLRIANFEMETSALYGLGKLLGHRCLTVCVIIANRPRREFAPDLSKSVALLIENYLNKLSSQ
jgi:uridine phosphorylase